MSDIKLRPAIQDDKRWVNRLFQTNRSVIGGAEQSFYRFMTKRKTNQHMVVIPEVGVIHYLIRRRDAVTVIYEMAIDAAHRRKGYGSLLLSTLSAPIELTTNEANEGAIEFYKAHGFKTYGRKTSKAGVKMVLMRKAR